MKHWMLSTVALLFALPAGLSPAAVAADCSANPIVAENCLQGAPASEWDVNGAGDPTIQGYATDISVNRGQEVQFKVRTDASAYRIDIYRLGYYGGSGARKVATVLPSASLPQSQPACLAEPATGLVDCGNWAVSATWQVPATAVSGVYLGRLVRPDTGGASHMVFVVRNDTSTADLLFQTSDTTWQAYNDYGGNSLYTGAPAGRAYKVSYNRPFATRGNQYARAWLFGAEYPMIRWLEANGYDLAYASGVDTDRSGTRLLQHKVFLSVGHDEYWSASQRANVEAARDGGVHLAFFSGNAIFWKTRWEPSIAAGATPYRTLVTYKETAGSTKIDPEPNIWTGTWRDPRFSPPADGGRPENQLMGTIFKVNCCRQDQIVVPSDYSAMRFWRDTPVARLTPGQSMTLAGRVLGYEWDEASMDAFQPPGLVRLSSTTVSVPSYLLDFGTTYGTGVAAHSLTLYRHPSSALVFGAGTVRWSWGLDSNHDVDDLTPDAGTPPDPVIRQATVNLLADMGVQPATLQTGLEPAIGTTDTTAPVTSITAPTAGAQVAPGSTVVVSGTAADAGGVVGAVEVSTDGGQSWSTASGRASWTYSWLPNRTGTASIMVRAVDDSGNIEAPAASTSIEVNGTAGCPCGIWSAASTPALASAQDTGSVELGVKFRSSVAGYVIGIRFYKGPNNGGTHVGNLWSGSGQLLATATFANETATGWQQVNFASPVAIAADTVYVASYFAPQGGYAVDLDFFVLGAVDNGPLRALGNTESGGNGVYAYGSGSLYPSQTFRASNYWVDPVFVTDTGSSVDTQPPTLPASVGISKVNGFPRLAWTASTDNVGVAGYRIHRSTNGTFGPAYKTTTGTSFVDDDTATVKEGTRYSYAVVAFDAAGNTSARSALRTTIAGKAPTAPTMLRASLVNGKEVQLTWNAAKDNVAVVEYVVYRSTIANTQGSEIGRSPTTRYTDKPLGGATYWYTVRARDTVYTSWRSNFASITVPVTTNPTP